MYSHTTIKSLEIVDEELVNYDLLEALVVHIVHMETSQGPGALLRVGFSNEFVELHRLTYFAITAKLCPLLCSTVHCAAIPDLHCCA